MTRNEDLRWKHISRDGRGSTRIGRRAGTGHASADGSGAYTSVVTPASQCTTTRTTTCDYSAQNQLVSEEVQNALLTEHG